MLAILATGCYLSLVLLAYVILRIPPPAPGTSSRAATIEPSTNIARTDLAAEMTATNTPAATLTQSITSSTKKRAVSVPPRLDLALTSLMDLPGIASETANLNSPGNLACVARVSGGLVTEMRTIFDSLPGPGSNAMKAPSETQMLAWESLVRALAEGDIDSTCQLIKVNNFPYHVLDFTDLPNDNEPYWVLIENQPLTVGWGSYVFRRQGPYSEMVIEIPHIQADSYTEMQGVDIFRQGRARALLIAGTHRCANTSYSTCMGMTMACGQLEPYRTSDVGHETQSIFQVTHRVLVPCGGSRVALQLHGNSLAGCPDAFISNGSLYPHQISTRLSERTLQRCSLYTVDLADGGQPSGGEQPECAFTSGSSVQAVYSNGCSRNPPIDACKTYVEQVPEPETFLSIEQSLNLRQDSECLVKAIKDTFPAR